MKVNGINLDTLPKEAITPLQLKVLIAQAKVKAHNFALAIFKTPKRRA